MFQLSRAESKMTVWEIYFSLDTANFIRRPIKLPVTKSEQNFDATINIDGMYFVVDGHGTLWSVRWNA